MKSELKKIDERIEHCRAVIRQHTAMIETMEKQRATYYKAGFSDLPFCLMEEREKAKIMKLPIGPDCEYCDKRGSVRVGKKSICINCGHEQSK